MVVVVVVVVSNIIIILCLESVFNIISLLSDYIYIYIIFNGLDMVITGR